MVFPVLIEGLYQGLAYALGTINLLGRIGSLFEVLKDLLEDLLDVDSFLRRTLNLQHVFDPSVVLGHLPPGLLELSPVFGEVSLIAEDEDKSLLILGNFLKGLDPLY